MISEHCNYRLADFHMLVALRDNFMLFLCIVNVLFSLVAILGNIVVIRALRKASSIPTNLKTLFQSLAVSDLAVGLMVQPLSSGIITVMLAKPENGLFFLCPTILTTFWFLSFFLAAVSFTSIVAIALDRLLALTLHLRYQALVTPRRIVILTVIIWTTGSVAAMIAVVLPSRNDMVAVFGEALGLLGTTVAYLKITKVARHHRKQIGIQRRQVQNAQAIHIARIKKSSNNTVFVYLVFLACYLPSLCSLILFEVFGSRISILVFAKFCSFITYLNSSLNPFIYCWRYREIGQIVWKMVKKILMGEPQD